MNRRNAMRAMAAVLVARPAAAAPTGWRLMAVTARDCHESAAFLAEAAPRHAATPEGRAAPLLLQPLDAPWPDGLAIGRAPRVTPSFLLLRDGVELARFEGYRGWDEHRRRLGRALAEAGA